MIEHPRRTVILTALAAGPKHFRALHRATGIPMGTLTHHAWRLVRLGAIQQTRVGGFLVFHLPTASVREVRGATDPAAVAVLEWVKPEPEPQCRILDRCPWSKATTQHRLERAVKHGFLERRTYGRFVTYRVVA